MGLSSDLVSQFVKITNDDTDTKKETTVYGTAVEYEGSIYVRIDGSDLLTPISKTTDVKPGERVTVMIKNHTATVTGNISSPAARTDDVKEIGNQISEFEIIVADKVSTQELEVERGRIDELISDNVLIKGKLTANEASIKALEADNVTINEKLTANEASIAELETNKLDAKIADITYATITDLEATTAEIHSLEATYGDFESLTTEKFAAIDASIKNLDTEKLSAIDADLRYANIDFSNIGKAAIEEFYAKSGLIEDIVVGDGTITGKLVGVTIKGNLIEGGTIVADKLVVKGEDGLYYKLNTDGVTTEAEQTEYNSLNGSVITAKSITATKISVSDLVAFDATIGGFNITDSSIYSGVKETVDNTTSGIYLCKDGQVAFGDGTNFLKYYKDQNGNYKLEISASNIVFSASGKDAETTIEDLEQDFTDKTEEITNIINTQNTSITSACESIILEALKSYTETSDFNSFKETVQAQLSLLADELTVKFTRSQSEIESVNNDLNNKFNTITKYFTFDINGLTIGQVDSKYKVIIDNDRYSMTVDDIEVMWIANGEVHTPEIAITKKVNIFGYSITEDENGNVNCEYIGE